MTSEYTKLIYEAASVIYSGMLASGNKDLAPINRAIAVEEAIHLFSLVKQATN